MEKLTINDLPEDVVAEMRRMINEDSQMVALHNKKAQMIRAHRYADAMKITSDMKRIEACVINEYLANYEGEVKRMDNLMGGMSEEDIDTINTCTNSIIFLSDMIETFVMDANEILKKYHPDYRIEMFDKLTQLGKEAHNQIKFMSDCTQSQFQVCFADSADDITELVRNKVRSFHRKLHKKTAKNG